MFNTGLIISFIYSSEKYLDFLKIMMSKVEKLVGIQYISDDNPEDSAEDKLFILVKIKLLKKYAEINKRKFSTLIFIPGIKKYAKYEMKQVIKKKKN